MAQGPLVPTLPWMFRDPGPYTPGSLEWNAGNTTVTNPSGGGTISVQHFGIVYYPSDGNGGVLQPITPYPFVVFAHGRFHTAPFIGQNHKQASYLLQHLASWGFVVASVNLDVVGQFTAGTIVQRGELINKTVPYIASLPQFQTSTDFSNIIYIGHSRGGEGVFAAVQQNPAWASSIRGVAAIAPTNFQSYKISTNAFVIYGSQDGDVNNGWPVQLFDQTNNDRIKGFRFIEGANHFFFTDSITFGPEVNAQLTRPQHHEIARTLMTTWCAALEYGDKASLNRIAGDKEIQWSAAFKMHRMYFNPRRITVDNFEQSPFNVLRNTLGGTNLLTGIIGAAESNINSTAASSYFHVTRGLIGRWSTPALFSADTVSNIDITGYNFVSVNVLQRYNVSSNPFNQAQRFRISLQDGDGNIAKLDNTDVGPWPYPFNASPNGPVKSVFKTFRFPTTAFQAQNSLVDLKKIRKVIVDFDVTATGEFALDELAVTQ